MDNGERGMNPATMTIINPRMEYCTSWGSNLWPLVLKSYMIQTELWGLAMYLQQMSNVIPTGFTACAKRIHQITGRAKSRVTVCLLSLSISPYCKPAFEPPCIHTVNCRSLILVHQVCKFWN